MLRAIWSFWSRPFQQHYAASWGDPVTHSLSWVVSVHAARQHYPDTLLVTDTPGKQLLVDRLSLPFTAVTTELDRLDHHDYGWWALGKLVAYGLQTAPFVHIDSDAYLWKRLPPALEQAPVLAQHPESYVADHGCYRPDTIERAMAMEGGILPPEWEWARSRGPELNAANCGILGGQDTAFLRHYARTAIALIERPENAAAWRRIGDKRAHNVVLEQFLLSACLGYHCWNDSSPFRGVRVEYLFPTWDDATDANQAARHGFTHLMAWSKATRAARWRLERRVRRDHPDYLRRCELAANTMMTG